jgi:hypothetical protein
MPDSPGTILDKLTTATTAWEQNAADATFAKLTLTQFKAAIQPSLDERETITRLEKELAAAQNRRDDADVASVAALNKVVKSVVGDPDFGDDSSLYEAMGYVRTSEKKTGLTRKKSVTTPPAK